MAEAASTADKVSTADEAVATLVSTADKAVAEAASTADEASTADKAMAAHRLKMGDSSAGAKMCYFCLHASVSLSISYFYPNPVSLFAQTNKEQAS